jgi:hypothetical protein
MAGTFVKNAFANNDFEHFEIVAYSSRSAKRQGAVEALTRRGAKDGRLGARQRGETDGLRARDNVERLMAYVQKAAS